MARAITTVFSFGYWGWGNHTAQLVRAIDIVESQRGFGSPTFVDVRLSRSVRAKGFTGSAFGKLVGSRYVWLKGLGNRAIRDGIAGIRIDDPGAVDDLLQVVLAAAREQRRVVFFCACAWPRLDGEVACHRVRVGHLLLAAAKRKCIPLSLVEWPGSDAGKLDVDVALPMLRAVARGARTSVPVPLARERADASRLSQYASVGWGSTLLLRALDETLAVRSGPVHYGPQGWTLPVFEVLPSEQVPVRGTDRWRAQRGLSCSKA